jgi:nicotinamidase/pyrazinamidase
MSKALIIIDIQNEFAKHIFNIKTVIKNTEKLIAYFKNKKWPVFYIQDFHTDQHDPEFGKFGCHAMKGTKGVEYVNELKPNKSDILIRKKRLSAFFGTNLDKLLKQKKVKEIYLVGVYTDYCVLATAIDGFTLDYMVYVISDATGTLNQRRHKIGLKVISENSAELIKTQNLIKI